MCPYERERQGQAVLGDFSLDELTNWYIFGIGQTTINREGMGFKDARKKAIQHLTEGSVDHEVRNDIQVKNLLNAGVLTNEDVINLLNRTQGIDHETGRHFWDNSIEIHTCKPVVNNVQWYIKFYFTELNIMFMSVHD